MPGPITPEVVRQIEKMAKAGYTRVAIAKATGLHRVTVGRHFGDSRAQSIDARKNDTPAQASSAQQSAKLAYILDSFAAGPCPDCAQTMFALRGVSNGFCNYCGEMWSAVPVEQSASAGRRR